MANEINIEIAGDNNASGMLTEFGDTAVNVLDRQVGTAAESMAGSMEEASSATEGTTGAGERLSQGFTDLAGSVTAVMDGIGAVTDLMGTGSRYAQEYAQAQVDVKQATLNVKRAAGDAEQATLDYTQGLIDEKQAARNAAQANLDFKQSLVDGTQAVIDADQANINIETALLDTADAQDEYNKAVKEYGPNSTEAKRASLALKQAQLEQKNAQNELSQATLDGEQATEDGAQANLDGEQAANDAKQAQQDQKDAVMNLEQANIDAAQAIIELKDAQSNLKSFGPLKEIQAYASAAAPVVLSLAGAMNLLTIAQQSNMGATMKNIGAQIAQKASMVGSAIATAAQTTATGIATAATWLWNAAMAVATSPITLIVVGIAALVGAIVWLATQTQFFQTIWDGVWSYVVQPVQRFWGWLTKSASDAWNSLGNGLNNIQSWFSNAWSNIRNTVGGVVNFIVGAPGAIVNAFSNVGNSIAGAFRSAFNGVSRAWNNTIGSFGFTVPDWVPGMGGSSWHLPSMPYLETGGDVLRTGAAIVHAGERVLNAQQVRMLESANNGGTNGGTLTLELAPKPGADNMLMRQIINQLSITVASSGGNFDSMVRVV